MARTKANVTQNPDKQKQKQKQKQKSKPNAKCKAKKKKNQASSKLFGEHEDDVHEAMLCLLQTEKLSKDKLLMMAKYGGVEKRVGRILEQVRGVDISSPIGDVARHNGRDDDDEDGVPNASNNSNAATGKRSAFDFYDPSILASPSASDCNKADDDGDDRLLMEEIIDLARGGAGGHYTNTLRESRSHHRSKQRSKQRDQTATAHKTRSDKKRKRKCVEASSLDTLPVSPTKTQTQPQPPAQASTKKKRKLEHGKGAPKCRYSSLQQFVSKSNHENNDINRRTPNKKHTNTSTNKQKKKKTHSSSSMQKRTRRKNHQCLKTNHHQNRRTSSLAALFV